ncbi:response regulator [Alteromonas sp. a30]|uniref:response regulator n=1 Tax=Alteromonas sp. a30 TaxID=2730917 RepID=UPI0022821DC7|nr:response regulator [Alteromonas sp. a30]MCY7295349.1 response regulator [Alteromonas sp. a30]
MADCAICILEPNDIEREILEGILAEEKDLHFFNSGEALLSSLKMHLPALVITETQVNGESGYDICRVIKRDFEAYNTTVVFLSSHTSVDERLKGLEAGADDYIFKPYDIIELYTKIKAARERITNQVALKQQLSLASDTAMQAMSAQSEMGCVLQAVRDMNCSSNFDQLCDALFSCLKKFDLGCTVFFYKIKEPTYVPTPGRQVTPIESQIITMVREQGRIWERGSRAVFNFQRASLLVLNMPEDSDKAGRLRDSLCVLMEAFDVRVDNLNKQQQLVNARERQDAVREICNLLSNASSRLRDSVSNSHVALRELVNDFWELVPRLGLEEDQETAMHRLMDRALEDINRGFEESEETCAIVSRVIDRLQKI